MTDLPECLFANPVWHSLQTKHRHLAITANDACRYPGDIAPFAAVAEPGTKALEQLATLLKPGESVWLTGENHPPVANLSIEGTLPCLQMVLPGPLTPSGSAPEIVPLDESNADEMVALISLTFPGFFRNRTYEMGNYYGVRSGGELIAMGGERLRLDGYSEISGICTHPSHRGKGLAASIIRRIAEDHRRDGVVSWLQVGTENSRAIDLYSWLGFQRAREFMLTRVSRNDAVPETEALPEFAR